MNKVVETGDFDKIDQLQQQLVAEKKKLQAELEDKRNEIRKGK
jgi:hypothetical protein